MCMNRIILISHQEIRLLSTQDINVYLYIPQSVVITFHLLIWQTLHGCSTWNCLLFYGHVLPHASRPTLHAPRWQPTVHCFCQLPINSMLCKLFRCLSQATSSSIYRCPCPLLLNMTISILLLVLWYNIFEFWWSLIHELNSHKP